MSDADQLRPGRVGVIGSGTMGRGIALAFSRAGIPCVIVDVSEELTREGQAGTVAAARAARDNGLLSAAEALAVERNLESAWPLEQAVDGCELVIEAVSEDLGVKRGVYERVEPVVDRDAVIATSTSAIPVAQLSEFIEQPRRFLGTHWFNPAPWVPGLEVIRGPATEQEVVDRVIAVHERLGKRPVVVPDRPGFVANRLQVAMFAEAARILAEGDISAEDIDEVVRTSFGFRLPLYGPFTIADLAGLDVHAAVFETLERELGERFRVPPVLAERVREGHLGSKSGQGFLSWPRERVAAETERRDVALDRIGNAIAGGHDR